MNDSIFDVSRDIGQAKTCVFANPFAHVTYCKQKTAMLLLE